MVAKKLFGSGERFAHQPGISPRADVPVENDVLSEKGCSPSEQAISQVGSVLLFILDGALQIRPVSLR